MSNSSIETSSSISSLIEEFNIITHNLANISTSGYKRRCTAFSKALKAAQAGSNPQETITIDTVFDFSQGNLIRTDRKLDFALSGKGFFVIETPQGPLYTRDGAFMVNNNGQVVDTLGRLVAGSAGPISIPSDIDLSTLFVANDGTISAGDISIGKFKIVDFGEDTDKLDSVGEGCFAMTNQNITPTEAQKFSVKQGYQESSNVTMIEELVNMIMVSRLYEANIKAMSAKSEATSSLMSVAGA